MERSNLGNIISRYLGIGLPFVTLGLLTGSVTDPVNAPKLMILGALSIAVLFLLLADWTIIRTNNYRFFKFALLFFVFWSLLSSIKSDSPFSQNFYGVYGRNTGFLAYLFLVILALAAAQLGEIGQIKFVLVGFYFAVGANLAYCLWVILFGDFVGWQNPYGAILGTFGNPNFISAFLGMSVGPQCAYFISGKTRDRVFIFISLSITALELERASSLQGFVITAVSIWLAIVSWLSSRMTSLRYSYSALLVGLLTAVTAVWGALGNGPLKTVMAQPTVELREQYWYAGIQMALKNPFFGVGMDSYGDWYRRSRGSQALITPGAETVTNVAHNVFIDVFSYGGFPLLGAYAVLTIIGVGIALRTIVQHDSFDPIRISLSTIFLTYQIQSIVSINQIGLAVWGWSALGLLVSLDRISKKSEQGSRGFKSHGSKNQHFVSRGLIGALGITVGVFLACPPLAADMKWASALKIKQLSSLEGALEGTYFSPINSFRLAQAVETLEKSNLPDLAVEYARRGVKFNRQSLNAWEMLYYATNSSMDEKARAKSKLISLDPLNQKWKDLN